MQCTILASGSGGNCLFIEGEDGALLVDAGLSAREILRRIEAAGKRADEVRAILVTHEHGDHVSGVDVLSRKLHVPVLATEGTLRDFLSHRCASPGRVSTRTCRYGEPSAIGDFTALPFATSHDAAEPCGFAIRENGVAIGICTDTGVMTGSMIQALTRCDSIVLESNHCPVMLKEGPYPESLKRRIRSERGHLSNDAAAECLRTIGRDMHHIVLCHLSEINNTPQRAMAGARSGLGLLFDGAHVIVASQKGTSPEHPQAITL
jgi:phosphoribosyl 1,2-cyclic phosphodiesterase